MKSKSVIKTLTLVVFVMLITGFVTYKSGVFEIRKPMPAKDYINNLPVDTPPKADTDSVRLSLAMMSTSKSLIITDPKLEFPVEELLEADSVDIIPEK